MRLATWAMVLATLATTAGCGHAAESRRGDTYVALGDSYTSGAGLARPDPASSACLRSSLNYPHLVAARLGLKLTDVSCAGAGTVDATAPRPLSDGTSAPPQLEAVGHSTAIVTVELGLNDFAWYDLVYGCGDLAAGDPTGHPCQDAQASRASSEETTGQIRDRVTAILEAVRNRAPSADVFLLGYPQLVPDTGSCAELPLATGDYGYVRDQLAQLDGQLHRAADDSHVTFVDVYAASKGHDVCAGDEAWVNGVHDQPGVALSFHPLARGQRAIADLVLDALRG